jgi:hypothetical protein
VNNIRNYYNIIKWLTENEAAPQEEEEPQEEAEPELIAFLAGLKSYF